MAIGKFSSVPVTHSAIVIETYENFKFILGKLEYAVYKWNICGNNFTYSWTKFVFCVSGVVKQTETPIILENNGLNASHSFLDTNM